MSGSAVTKSSVVFHAIAITAALGILSGQLPLQRLLNPIVGPQIQAFVNLR
jgi:hypothetical protein